MGKNTIDLNELYLRFVNVTKENYEKIKELENNEKFPFEIVGLFGNGWFDKTAYTFWILIKNSEQFHYFKSKDEIWSLIDDDQKALLESANKKDD